MRVPAPPEKAHTVRLARRSGDDSRSISFFGFLQLSDFELQLLDIEPEFDKVTCGFCGVESS
jgi:hypothetical protein